MTRIGSLQAWIEVYQEMDTPAHRYRLLTKFAFSDNGVYELDSLPWPSIQLPPLEPLKTLH